MLVHVVGAVLVVVQAYPAKPSTSANVAVKYTTVPFVVEYVIVGKLSTGVSCSYIAYKDRLVLVEYVAPGA